jgi:hypothetical protein
MLRKPLLVLGLLLVASVSAQEEVVLHGSPADRPGGRSNTWSAASSTGLTLMGTWTAVADPKTGHVTGRWTLIDAQGRTVARGGWSAAKAAAGWTGGWRATIDGRSTEYSGTWSAGAGLPADAPLPDLFAKAVRDVVSGRWRAGRQSGTWSIRAFD